MLSTRLAPLFTARSIKEEIFAFEEVVSITLFSAVYETIFSKLLFAVS